MVQQKSGQLDVAGGPPSIHAGLRCEAVPPPGPVTLFTCYAPTHASTQSSSEFAPGVPNSLSSREI